MKKIKKAIKILEKFIDYFMFPTLIFFMSYDPNFFHGFLVTNDEGYHLALINGILHGKVIYRDMYMLYGPLLEYLPAALMKIFGPSLVLFRGFYHFGTIFSLIFAYFLARSVIRTRFFLFLLTWLLLVTKVCPFWSSRWGGIRTGIGFLALIVVIVYIRRKRWYWLFFAGVITGVSFLTSQDIGICVIFGSLVTLLGLFFLNHYHQKTVGVQLKTCFKEISAYATGFMAIVLPFVIYASSVGAFFAYLKTCFIDVPYKFPKFFVTSYPFLPLPDNLSFSAWFSFLNSRSFYFYGAILIYFLGTIYLIVKAIKKESVSNFFCILPLLSFGALLLKLATRQIYGMQFNMAAPPILIIGTFLMEGIFLRCKTILKRRLKNIFKVELLCIIVILSLSFSYINMATMPYQNIINIIKTYKWAEVVKFLGQEETATPEQIYAERSGRWGRLNLERAKGILVPQEQAEILTEVVDYIKKNTFPDEPIFVFSHNGQYFFLTDRLGATRFYSVIHASVDPEYQNEIIKDLQRSKLRYIIYVADAYVFTDLKKVPNEVRLSMVFNYMKQNYYKEARFGQTYILRREGS